MHGFMGPVTCVPGEQTGCRALTPVTPGDSVGVASVGTDTPDLFPVQNIFFLFFRVLLEATKNPDWLFFFLYCFLFHFVLSYVS